MNAAPGSCVVCDDLGEHGDAELAQMRQDATESQLCVDCCIRRLESGPMANAADRELAQDAGTDGAAAAARQDGALVAGGPHGVLRALVHRVLGGLLPRGEVRSSATDTS
jgi:hypothetical protein